VTTVSGVKRGERRIHSGSESLQ